ncbi:MAG: transcriptional regulator, XRE family protein [Phenylobacterium zucineum]|nr:MAG: transcriptional regulator, XRE family protein [Phenylobacterium zucineum]
MTLTLHRALDQKGPILTKAVVRAADKLNLSGAVAASALGLSEASFSRMRQDAFILTPDSKPYELGAHLVRLYRALDAIVGGDDRAAAVWMHSPNSALGARPVDLITTIRGLFDVIAYLDARRARL